MIISSDPEEGLLILLKKIYRLPAGVRMFFLIVLLSQILASVTKDCVPESHSSDRVHTSLDTDTFWNKGQSYGASPLIEGGLRSITGFLTTYRLGCDVATTIYSATMGIRG